MSASPLEYLRHILDETRFISSAIQGVTEQAFMGGEALKRAFVRSIEIIGEASSASVSTSKGPGIFIIIERGRGAKCGRLSFIVERMNTG